VGGKGREDGWQVGVGSELLVTVPPPLGLAKRISPALLRRCCYGWCGARRFGFGMGEWGGGGGGWVCMTCFPVCRFLACCILGRVGYWGWVIGSAAMEAAEGVLA